jgi:enterochelin esterase-like enzyme
MRAEQALAWLSWSCLLAPAMACSQHPATSNVPGAGFPSIGPDLSVTFQFNAPNAKAVQVQVPAPAGEANGLGKGPFDMMRDQNGTWTVTTPPAVPGLHAYWLVVDGTPMNDPASRTYPGNREVTAVEVPEPGVDFYLPKDVPHGHIHEFWYYSKLTESSRKINVYTPPGYEQNPRTRYPVLYLRHGGGENADGWVQWGQMYNIMDNLLAAGKIKPMLVVMAYGYAEKPGETTAGGMTPEFSPHSTVLRVEMEEVLPMIDADFRTIADRDHRAIAGPSRGARQAFDFAWNYPDKYSFVGAFSGPIVGPMSGPNIKDFDRNSAYGGLFKDAAAFNKRIHLLWLGAGTAEHAQHDSARLLHETLDHAGIHNVFVEIPGTSHEWQTWRKSLYDFAPRLFR